MLTTDLSMKLDPIYGPISKRFYENPQEFAEAFAKAWYKLTHRDMGPISRYLGPEVPAEAQIWQDPLPAVDHPLIDDQDVAALKTPHSRLGTHRHAARYDRMGVGLNVPRHRQARRRQRRALRLAPQKDWAVNKPAGARKGAADARKRCRRISTHRSRAARKSRSPTSSSSEAAPRSRRPRKMRGHDVNVSFAPGRTDATQEKTDMHSFAVLEPTADGFRNYLGTRARALARAAASRPRASAHANRARDDRSRRRPARARRKRRRLQTRRLYEADRNADERLLCESARHFDEVAAGRRRYTTKDATGAPARSDGPQRTAI